LVAAALSDRFLARACSEVTCAVTAFEVDDPGSGLLRSRASGEDDDLAGAAVSNMPACTLRHSCGG